MTRVLVDAEALNRLLDTAMHVAALKSLVNAVRVSVRAEPTPVPYDLMREEPPFTFEPAPVISNPYPSPLEKATEFSSESLYTRDPNLPEFNKSRRKS